MKNADIIAIELLIADYLELNSTYKVAKKHDVSATAVKRLLKKAGVLRTQNFAATVRNLNNSDCGKYERTKEHREHLSTLASNRTGSSNPFFGKTHSDSTKKAISEGNKRNVGKRNPNYKDGTYIRRPRDFQVSKFAPVRNRVFNRDDHSCYYCRAIGGHLHAHHILPYWVQPSAFLDDENLITVCSNCHFTEAHKSNWQNFDFTPITDYLLSKYSLSRERLNDLTGIFQKR